MSSSSLLQQQQQPRFGFQPEFTAPGGHPLHLRSYVPPHVTVVALDGRMGTHIAPLSNPASSLGGNARRIVLDPYVRNATSLRLRSVELPLTFHQFSAARGNTVFAYGGPGVADSGFGGTASAVPDGNYTADTLVDALSAPGLAFSLETSYTDFRGVAVVGGPPRVRITNSTSAEMTVLFAVHGGAAGGAVGGCAAMMSSGGLKRELPASQLGWSLGFRAPAYLVPPSGGSVVAEAGVSTQPLRAALVRLAANPAFLREGFQAAQAGEAVAKVLLPPADLFGSDGDTASVRRHGTVLCATEANGLLQAGTRAFRETATVPNTPAAGAEIRQLDVEILDEFGRPLDLQGDTFSLTLEITHG